MSNYGAKKAREKADLARRSNPGLAVDSGVISVQAHELPAPTRSITANWGDVRREGPHFELTFGQELASEGRLSAALHVTIEVTRLMEVLDTGDFMADLRKHVEESDMLSYVPRKVAMPVERNVFERATISFFAQTKHEAEARFFHFSPGDAYAAKQNPGMTAGQLRHMIKPVVTVLMSSSVLWYISNKCQELAR